MFQLLTAMFFQKFSVAPPEGNEVKDEAVGHTIVNFPKPFEVVVTKRMQT